jgi:CheY-like chemotaxis protein
MARVLLVDPHPSLRSAARRALEVGGHSVVEAETATDGLRKLEELHLDVVIVDALMVDQAGAAVTQVLRQRFPSTRIVALRDEAPAGGTPVDLRGADCTVFRPFAPETLVRVIGSLVDPAGEAPAGSPTP